MRSWRPEIAAVPMAAVLCLPSWSEDLLEHPSADIQRDGQVIHRIEVGTRALTPRYRADSANERLLKFAGDLSRGPGSLAVEEVEVGSRIAGDDTFILLSVEEAAAAGGGARREPALEMVKKMKESIRDYREKRSLCIISQGGRPRLRSGPGSADLQDLP